jgi:hypothetical protein
LDRAFAAVDTAVSTRPVRLLNRIHDASDMPLIPFKYNATGKSYRAPGTGGDIWAKMYHIYMYRREKFFRPLSSPVKRRFDLQHD